MLTPSFGCFSQKNGVPVKTNIASPYSSAQKNSALLEKLKASNQKEKSSKQGFYIIMFIDFLFNLIKLIIFLK